MGILRRGRHSWPAPHHRPAVRLEILGDVPLAPIPTAPLGRRSLTEWEPPTRLCTTVEARVRGLAGEGMLEVRDAGRFRAGDDDEQTGHRPPSVGLAASDPHRHGWQSHGWQSGAARRRPVVPCAEDRERACHAVRLDAVHFFREFRYNPEPYIGKTLR